MLAGLALLPAGGARQRVRRDPRPQSGSRREIDALQAKIEAAREREGVLTSQIEVVTSKIHALEDDVDAASARLDQLENVLALHQRKLDRLNQLFRVQTRKLVFLQRQHKAATQRLNRRLVEIYTSEPTDALTVVLEAASFSDLIDQLDYLNDIGAQDERIATEVKHAKLQMQETRNATRRTRKAVAATTRGGGPDRGAARGARPARLEPARARHRAARQARHARHGAGEQAGGDRAHARAAGAERRARSADPARHRARSIVARPDAEPPSAAGFIWPVHGVVTSGYGWRWGRMHEGIDIAVASGTPVVAAASGTVIVAGWMGGYGNLVVIDHGNGISTAYGHNSSVTVGAGQLVAQGQLIAYSGSTGHSTGPHVHFEVRINGSPVDPLGYL